MIIIYGAAGLLATKGINHGCSLLEPRIKSEEGWKKAALAVSVVALGVIGLVSFVASGIAIVLPPVMFIAEALSALVTPSMAVLIIFAVIGVFRESLDEAITYVMPRLVEWLEVPKFN